LRAQAKSGPSKDNSSLVRQPCRQWKKNTRSRGERKAEPSITLPLILIFLTGFLFRIPLVSFVSVKAEFFQPSDPGPGEKVPAPPETIRTPAKSVKSVKSVVKNEKLVLLRFLL
jgi:hypothetical protein